MRNVSFHIATRYLIAKKGSTAVTFITWLAALAMTVAVSAMFIILSVFSGLEELNRDLIANIHSDLTIKSKVGKTLPNIQALEKTLKKDTQILSFSKVIEEKIYIDYSGKGDIAFLRGTDSAYVKVNPIDKTIFYGIYPSFDYSNEVAMEYSLINRLSIPVGDTSEYATVFMPKAGSGLINKEEDIFNKKQIYVTGVFPGKDQLNNYILAPIELTAELLNLDKKSAYNIVIKLKDTKTTEQVRDKLSAELGQNYIITTKQEENSAFWKMINIEKLFIYVIFALVILITTFNLAGAIIILQLDKKQQAKSLISLGFPIYFLRRIYFYTGILIVIIGIFTGLLIGTAICYFQLQTGFFKANEALAFPIRITFINYIIIAITAATLGTFISWIFSKINKRYITN